MNEKDLFNQYVEKMESIDDDYFHNLNRDLYKGHNSYLRMRMKGSSFFNDEWISKIEDCIYELGQIVNNPLEVTSTEGNLTPIELAKKINYESIQHLASHSQYIKDIDEEGNVVPAKILSQFHKEELHTYENRFIATFIRRLVLFVEKRYEFIRTTVSFDTKDVLYIKNKSIVDGQEVSIETKVTVKKENEDSESKIGREYVERVEKMRKYVNYFYNSPFMKELKTEKDVRKPILQTNIIRKNPLYHKCYETFLFIERFNSLGVEYALDQHYQAFSEKERKALNYILASHLLSLGSTEKSRKYKKSRKTYKPKLLSSIDDEMFIYGDMLKGPIEFVRVDEKYNEYLRAKAELKAIPKKPNKVEKEYFKEEIDLKKNTEKHIKEIDLLLKRIRREIAKWEKYVQELIEQRNIDEAKEAQARLEELRRQEAEILERRRAEIIAAALNDQKDNIPLETPAKTKEPAIEDEIAEEKVEEAKSEPAEQPQEENIEEVKPGSVEEAKPEEVEEALLEETVQNQQEETKESVIVEETAPVEEPEQTTEEQTQPEESVAIEEKPVEEVKSEQSEESQPEASVAVVAEAVQEEVQESVEADKVEEVVVELEEAKEEQPKLETQPVIIEEQPAEEVKEEIVEAEKVEIEENSQEKPEILVEDEPQVEEANEEEKTTKNLLKEEKSPRKPGYFERRAARRAEKEAQKLEAERQKAQLEEEKAKALEEIRLAKEAEKKATAEAKAKQEAEKKAAQEAKVKEEAAKAEAEAARKAAQEAKAREAKAKTKVVEELEPQRERDILKAIPGRFIVKTLRGYYISDREFSNQKSKAIIFKDFNKARRIKELYGGKVIKL